MQRESITYAHSATELTRSSHVAGSCWLLTAAAKGKPHKNRVSGGDLTPQGPPPPPDESGGHYTCGPGEYCAMAMAGNLWPRTFSDGISKQGNTAPLIRAYSYNNARLVVLPTCLRYRLH